MTNSTVAIKILTEQNTDMVLNKMLWTKFNYWPIARWI